jgi:hypothetical protein
MAPHPNVITPMIAGRAYLIRKDARYALRQELSCARLLASAVPIRRLLDSCEEEGD